MIQVLTERYFRANYNSYIKWDAHPLQQSACKKPSRYGRIKNEQNKTKMKVEKI